jgi:hypothetical protein
VAGNAERCRHANGACDRKEDEADPLDAAPAAPGPMKIAHRALRNSRRIRKILTQGAPEINSVLCLRKNA